MYIDIHDVIRIYIYVYTRAYNIAEMCNYSNNTTIYIQREREGIKYRYIHKYIYIYIYIDIKYLCI